MTVQQFAAILFIVAIFNVKHFIGDFCLQNEYMLGKFKKVGWQLALLAHVATVAQFTFWIALISTHSFMLAAALTVFEMVTHFIIDRVKASPDLGGRYKPDQKMFWMVLGADQMLHHCIDLVTIFFIFVYKLG